jgi:hypothetical protein
MHKIPPAIALITRLVRLCTYALREAGWSLATDGLNPCH